MKRIVLMALALGLMTGAANAAILSMQFTGGATEVTLTPSQTVVVEIYYQLFGKPTTSKPGISGIFNKFGAAEGLYMTSATAAPTGWGSASVPGVLGPGGAEVSLGTATTPLLNAGTYLLGTVVIHQNSIMGDFQIVFLHAEENSVTISNALGPDVPYDSITNGPINDKGWMYGPHGCPGVYQGQLRDPLIVHCIPEPASLALLALGGLAMLRRRS